MKSNFNKSKRWAPKSNKKRELKEKLPERKPIKKEKEIDIAKVLEIQERLKREKEDSSN